eukprot:6482134-Amphidinium_carterae.1
MEQLQKRGTLLEILFSASLVKALLCNQIAFKISRCVARVLFLSNNNNTNNNNNKRNYSTQNDIIAPSFLGLKTLLGVVSRARRPGFEASFSCFVPIFAIRNSKYRRTLVPATRKQCSRERCVQYSKAAASGIVSTQ